MNDKLALPPPSDCWDSLDSILVSLSQLDDSDGSLDLPVCDDSSSYQVLPPLAHPEGALTLTTSTYDAIDQFMDQALANDEYGVQYHNSSVKKPDNTPSLSRSSSASSCYGMTFAQFYKESTVEGPVEPTDDGQEPKPSATANLGRVGTAWLGHAGRSDSSFANFQTTAGVVVREPLETCGLASMSPTTANPCRPLVADAVGSKREMETNLPAPRKKIKSVKGKNSKQKPADTKADRHQRPLQDVNDNDVLFGRGGGVNSRPGNERLLTLARAQKQQYRTARTTAQKQAIAHQVQQAFLSTGARFVVDVEGVYYTAREEVVLQRIKNTMNEKN